MPFVLRRKTIMMAEIHIAKDRGTEKSDVSYKVNTAHIDRVSKARTVEQKTKTQPLWVDHMIRIKTAGDQQAFADLFQYFAPRVKAFLMKKGASDAVADDVTQDVMATIWRKAHMFDPSRASVATWVFTVARNRFIDVIRKQNRPEPEDVIWGPEHEPDQADVIVIQQESARLVQAMSELPEKQRDLIQKAYFGDLSHSEIAAETGLPLGTIKSRIRLALERLRHVMK